MNEKSLVSVSLLFAFSIVGYITYVRAVLDQDSSMIIITSLIYFFPIFIGFADDIQSLMIGNRHLFVMLLVCFLIGLLYTCSLWAYLSLNMQNFNNIKISVFMRALLIVLPVSCIPIKGYPLFVKIMQLYNRSIKNETIH